MIGKSQQALLLRRQRLIARSEELRGRLLLETVYWRVPLATADRIFQVGRWLHAQRNWLIGVAVLLLAARPQLAFRWLRRGWWAWRLSRRLRPWLALVGSRARGSS